jgi:hypothetical protein
LCEELFNSPLYFLESTLYGMDAMAPSPPTPLPRFTGARGGFCVVLDHEGTRIAIRARARARNRNRIRIHYRESLLPRMSAAIEYRPPGRTEYEYEFVFWGGLVCGLKV